MRMITPIIPLKERCYTEGLVSGIATWLACITRSTIWVPNGRGKGGMNRPGQRLGQSYRRRGW